jgi:hypothetical protein
MEESVRFSRSKYYAFLVSIVPGHIISCATTKGQTVWVEKNQALLERYEDIVNVLKNGKIHHRAGKAGREHVGKERNNA